MNKHKSSPKEKEKGGQLVVRVDKSDRAAFTAHCGRLDTTAAREMRRLMREFIASGTPAVATAGVAYPTCRTCDAAVRRAAIQATDRCA